VRHSNAQPTNPNTRRQATASNLSAVASRRVSNLSGVASGDRESEYLVPVPKQTAKQPIAAPPGDVSVHMDPNVRAPGSTWKAGRYVLTPLGKDAAAKQGFDSIQLSEAQKSHIVAPSGPA
jgi:hypothetical protein